LNNYSNQELNLNKNHFLIGLFSVDRSSLLLESSAEAPGGNGEREDSDDGHGPSVT
jgi:hypothetical protein